VCVCVCVCVQCGWYWGAIGWEEAEKQLASERDGSFLLRDSSDDRYLFSLSFRALDATHHTRIEHYKGQLLPQPPLLLLLLLLQSMILMSIRFTRLVSKQWRINGQSGHASIRSVNGTCPPPPAGKAPDVFSAVKIVTNALVAGASPRGGTHSHRAPRDALAGLMGWLRGAKNGKKGKGKEQEEG